MHKVLSCRSLSQARRARGVPQVRAAKEPAVGHVRSVLYQEGESPRQLPKAEVQEVRRGYSCTSCAGDAWPRMVLLSAMRSLRQPDKKANSRHCGLRQLREVDRETPVGSRKTSAESRTSRDSRQSLVLLSGLLVLMESRLASLVVVRRSARADVPAVQAVEKGRAGTGQESVSLLRPEREAGGAPHSPVSQSPRDSLGRGEWHHAL